MKKLIQMALMLFSITAFSEKDGKKIITEDQKKILADSGFSPEFMTQLETAINEDTEIEANDKKTVVTEANTEAFEKTAVGVLTSQLVTLKNQVTTLNTEKSTLAKDKETLAAEKLDLSSKIKTLSTTIETLSSEDENLPKVTKAKGEEKDMDITNDKFLMGVEHSFMAIDDAHPYNKRAYAQLMARQGIAIPTTNAIASDYTTLNTDLGAFNRVRYNDKIQSFIRELPSLAKLFPVQSGYMDQAVLVNLFMNSEFSQADNTSLSSFDNVLKGGHKFEDEIITMYDVMFAYKFTSLVDLEKNWLASWNKEGSNVIKWSFVEYILTQTTIKLHNEREQRYINGKRVNPTANVAGSALAASNGYRQFFKNQIAAFKMKPFTMGDWDNTTAVAYAKSFCSNIPQVIRDSGSLKLYVPFEFKKAYNENYRTLWSLSTLDSVATQYVQDYPAIEMIIVPNLSPSRMLVATLDGNLSLFEFMPGDMTNFSLEQQDWGLKVWSRWKESFWAFMVGQKMADANSFPDDYSSQMIWINDVDLNLTTYTAMDKDATIPSVAAAKALVSSASNSALQTITNITGGVTGDEIRLKCGHATLGIKVLQANANFVLTADWIPAKGDILYLVQRSDGKFFEINRTTAASVATAFAANATAPDVTGFATFVTVANGGATALTTLTNAVVNKVYTIYGGSATNSTTIANAGNFVLTAAMTLGVGNWIQLRKSATDSKFYEIARG